MNKKLKHLIDLVDYVSFDIFDTLIFRRVCSPHDIFDCVEKKYNEINNTSIKFKKMRVETELNLRKKSNSEITLEEIYKQMKSMNNNYNYYQLMELEIEYEIQACYVNQEMLDLLIYCKKQAKKIIISSDMYLSKKIIKSILQKNNITYDRIYVSSDIKLQKSTGQMYKYIKKDLDIDGKKLLHIGDNLKSDYIMARFNGIYAYRISFGNKTTNPLDKQPEYLNYKNSKHDYYEKFGYLFLGPLMFGFCSYLNNNIPDNKNIIFLAREGQFIRKCYAKFLDVPVNSLKYMYVSRQSISSSVYYKFNNLNDAIRSQSLSLNETVGMFLKRFGLLTSEIRTILIKENISLNDKLENKDVFQKLNNIYSDIFCDFEKKQNPLEGYIDKFNISNNSCIVDIGWNGTMQDLLQKILDEKKIKINGYYLGVRSTKKNKYKHGYLFDGENNDIEILSRSMTGFLEILFAANHGSTYSYNSSTFEPLLLENDVNIDTIQTVQKIQKGALRFILEFRKNSILNKYNKKIFYGPIYKFMLNPNLSDIKKFIKLEVYDQKKNNLIGNNLGLKYLLSPKKFIRDYKDSCWKNAFLKSIFKINLPYTLFFKFAYSKNRRLNK